jgi:hypothetical protein
MRTLPSWTNTILEQNCLNFRFAVCIWKHRDEGQKVTLVSQTISLKPQTFHALFVCWWYAYKLTPKFLLSIIYLEMKITNHKLSQQPCILHSFLSPNSAADHQQANKFTTKARIPRLLI